MKLTIPKGYRLNITTWENDADNYRTKTLVGLTEVQTNLYTSLAKMAYSKNNNEGCFGNMYEPSANDRETYEQALNVLGVQYKDVINNHCGEVIPDDNYAEVLFDVFVYNLGLRGSEFYLRVTESFTVEYYPEDVYAQDVTVDFI
jgi:hypothetical protein